MSNVPSLRTRSSKFRSGTSSHDHNVMAEETLYDLNNLFNLVNEQEALLLDAKSVMSTENKYQAVRIQRLEKELREIQNLYKQLQEGSGKYKQQVYVDKFQPDPAASLQEKAELDTYHSMLTLPVTGKTQSKIYLYDEITQDVVLPETLKVDVQPKSNQVNITDNDVMKAFGSNGEIWTRKYSFEMNDPVASVTTVVTMTLPDNIISNRDINTLVFHPFPLSTVDIDKIEYRMEGGWNLLPGFPQNDAGAPIPIEDASNVKFCFESIPMAEVRITLTQRNFLIENHRKVFYVGAAEIGVAFTDYQSSLGRFLVPAILEGKTETKVITGVIPHFKNTHALTDRTEEKRSIFNYSIYTIDSAGALQYTRDSLPIMVTGEMILIKANISADAKTGAAPALESVEIRYEDLV